MFESFVTLSQCITNIANIVPGYEYDIFISYRQKDNKDEGWVTEFLDNLKREPESIFKEEVSVYLNISGLNAE